jgi:methylenetetrahydrofolate dehydrogenase (NADP+)/methenyltetrahydrofolate cyclohydrolase
MARIIDGKAVAERLRDEVRAGAEVFAADHGRPPGLATILVGDDPASDVYVSGKQRACGAVGIEGFDHRLPATATQSEVADLIARLNDDPAVDGILLQLPVPAGLDADALTASIDPDKDVDGLTPVSAGRLALGQPGLRPCTPSGIILLLDAHDVPIEGAHAVVVGRSNLVGKPVSALLLARNATVTTCHSRTRDLAATCATADILVVAAGKAKMIGPAHVKPGAAVIDVGIHRTDDGLMGDVDFEAVEPLAGVLTPVPGGVGPMTITCLLRNTLAAARAREGVEALSGAAG